MKAFYWTSFIISIVALLLNVGLGLFALGIVIIPLLILHVSNGLRLHMTNHRVAIILSAVNLLAFALLRPDGAHAFTDTGLSALLDVVGINAGYDRSDEKFYFGASMTLLFIQAVMDIRLRKIILKASK